VCAVDSRGDYHFKLIDFDNACRSGDDHPGCISRGYACPEVFNKSAATELKASAAIDIFSFGLVLVLIGGAYANRGGLHGDYSVLPSKFTDSRLRDLLSNQNSLNEYIFGEMKEGDSLEDSWEHMNRKSWVSSFLSKMVSIDQNTRFKSLNDVIKHLDWNITSKKQRIADLEKREDLASKMDKVISKVDDIDLKLDEVIAIVDKQFDRLDDKLLDLVKGMSDGIVTRLENSTVLTDLANTSKQVATRLQSVKTVSEANQQLETLQSSFRSAIDEAINKASVASKEQLVSLKDDMLREVSGLKEEVAKQHPSQEKFKETLDAIAERTLSLGLQLDSLQADIKTALGELVNLGAATNAILVSNKSLGKAFESVRDMLKEDAEAIKGVEAAISSIKNTPSIPPALLQSMLAPMQEQLKALLMNVHEVPTWLCIYPHKSASMKEKLNPFNLVNNKYDAQCMCEWTHRLSSKVMQFTQPKAWVRINYLYFTFTFI